MIRTIKNYYFRHSQAQRKLFWVIFFTLILIISCDRDAFTHIDNASKFFKLGMYDQAIVELKTSNRLLKDEKYFQDSVYRHLMWGIIALKEGNQPKAIENFQAALKKEPGEIQIRFILSTLYLQQKKYAEALALFNDKTYQDVTMGGPDYIQGISAYYQGNIDTAIKHFEKMLRTLNEEYIYFSSSDTQKLTIIQLRQTVYGMLGEGCLQKGLYPSAIKYFTKALESDKENYILDAKLKIAMLHYQAVKEPKNSGIYASLAYYYSLLNLHDQAIKQYKKALAIYPKSAPAYLGLAEIYRNTKQYKKSEEMLKKALEYSNNPRIISSVYLALGQVYLEYGKYTQSLELFDKAGQLDPQNIAAQNELTHTKILTAYNNNPSPANALALAQSCQERQEYVKAWQYYSVIEKAEPKNTAMLIGKARTAYLQNYYKTAAEYYQKTLKTNPENTSASLGLADVYAAQENYDAAIKSLKKALLKDPQNVLLRNQLAFLYFNCGQNENAVNEWHYVLEHINNTEMSDVIEKIIEVIG